MPAKSKSQQRLFGMVHAYQKGELKDASKEIKDIANSISDEDAEDFAETKHKGLPNRVKKEKKNENVVKITDKALFEMIVKSIKKNINENYTSIGPNRWNDDFADVIFPAMKAIEEKLNDLNMDDAEEDIYSEYEKENYALLKKAYEALENLMY